MPPAVKPIGVAVFVGTRGRGSNLMAIHAGCLSGKIQGRVAIVVGSRPDAPALTRARDAGLLVASVDPKSFADPGDYARELLAIVRRAETDTIALAGYLRRLPEPVVEAYRHRIVNVHPALLPAFGGKGMYGEHVHRAVLDYGCKVSGCTVHLVDETYDTGPIIFQRTVSVEDDDTPETLAARILPSEHEAFVEALQLIATERLDIAGRLVRIRPPN